MFLYKEPVFVSNILVSCSESFAVTADKTTVSATDMGEAILLFEKDRKTQKTFARLFHQ